MAERVALTRTRKTRREQLETIISMLSERVDETVTLHEQGVDLAKVEVPGRASRLVMHGFAMGLLESAEAELAALDKESAGSA